MLIYVGGKWQEKAAVRVAQKALTEAGHDIISIWTQSKDTKSDLGLMQQALIDYSGVKQAEALVIVLVDEEDKYLSSSPNRYVEMGIALGMEIPIYIIGTPRSDEIFHRLPWVKHVESVQEVIDALRKSG